MNVSVSDWDKKHKFEKILKTLHQKTQNNFMNNQNPRTKKTPTL